MSLAAQAKVLRVLQDGDVTRIGGAKPMTVDVRVIAATNKQLEEEIAAGRFREDLFYRLNVVPIHVPPLRERREDIPLLVAHFVCRSSREREGVPPRDDRPGRRSSASSALDWPGNVRELRNTIERLLILAPGPRVTAGDVERLVGRAGGAPTGPAMGSVMESRTFEEFKRAAERAFLLAKLRAARLERVGNGASARHAALEPLQEDRALRAEPRNRGLTAPPHKEPLWPNETGPRNSPRSTSSWGRWPTNRSRQRVWRRAERVICARRRPTPPPRPARAAAKPGKATGSFGVFARLTLSVALGRGDDLLAVPSALRSRAGRVSGRRRGRRA